MTVVDSRGRRTPAAVRGREFSGPPKGQRNKSQRDRFTPTPRKSGGHLSKRPGAAVIWVLAAFGGGVAVAIGSADHNATGTPALLGYVFVAPLAAGLVHRGRALRLLICCLPLVFVLDLTIASAIALNQGGTKITTKGVLEEVGQVLVLHSPWLWVGTLLAVAVGARRGLFRRTVR